MERNRQQRLKKKSAFCLKGRYVNNYGLGIRRLYGVEGRYGLIERKRRKKQPNLASFIFFYHIAALGIAPIASLASHPPSFYT